MKARAGVGPTHQPLTVAPYRNQSGPKRPAAHKQRGCAAVRIAREFSNYYNIVAADDSGLPTTMICLPG